jgi:hypothetical protein
LWLLRLLGLLLALLARPDSCQLLQPVLDELLAVVSLVRNPLYEIVDVARGIDVGRSHLGELVEDPIPDLLPVLAQLLLDLLCLLLVHAVAPLLRVADPALLKRTSPASPAVNAPRSNYAVLRIYLPAAGDRSAFATSTRIRPTAD